MRLNLYLQGFGCRAIIISMDRKTFYETARDELIKVAQNPLVKDKKTIDTREISFEDMWEEAGGEKFTGYLTAANDYRWHTLLIDGNVRFSLFLGKGITLHGKEAILSMKSKWQNPPVTVSKLYFTKEAVESYYGMFSGLKIFDGVNPENIGIDRIFQKLKEEKFTGPAVFDTKDNKLVFLWHSGRMLHIFPAKNITQNATEKDLDEVMLSPFLNVTAVKAHAMSFNVPAVKLLYTKRATEFNALLLCMQKRLHAVIGTRIMMLIAKDVKEALMKRHMFYESLIQFRDYGIVVEPKILDKGVNRDLDEVIREIIEVYMERAKEDLGLTLVKKAFAECKVKGERKSEEDK